MSTEANRRRRDPELGRIPAGHYGITGVLRSEWTKLRTVRSTMWTLGLTVVLAIGLGALVTSETRSHWSSMSFLDRLTFDPTRTSLVGVFFGQFTIGILGALVMSAEYGTGTIRATFAASPRRPLVLAAKAIVFGAIALFISEVLSFCAFFLGQALLTAPVPHSSISSPGALRAVVGSGLYLCVLGLLALGIATIVRHTAAAISTFIGVLLVLPIIVATLPSSIGDPIRRYLPAHIGETIVSLHTASNSFGPWPSLLLLCGYAVGALVLGAVLLVRRDA